MGIFRTTTSAVAVMAMLALPAVAQNFDDPEEFARQQELLNSVPNGPEQEPWMQYFGEEMVDTSAHAVDGAGTVCFSNAGVNNPWRVVGWTTMQAEVERHPEERVDGAAH